MRSNSNLISKNGNKKTGNCLEQGLAISQVRIYSSRVPALEWRLLFLWFESQAAWWQFLCFIILIYKMQKCSLILWSLYCAPCPHNWDLFRSDTKAYPQVKQVSLLCREVTFWSHPVLSLITKKIFSKSLRWKLRDTKKLGRGHCRVQPSVDDHIWRVSENKNDTEMTKANSRKPQARFFLSWANFVAW